MATLSLNTFSVGAPTLSRPHKLKKELGLLNVYAIAAGATFSSGFFLLPGLAYVEAGPAVVLSYLIAAIILVPALCCQAELATAMPRAGGIYYFLDRAMGPLMGCIGGIGTWLTMILKAAFALVGIGAYLSVFFPNIPLLPISLVMALIIGAMNLGAVKAAATVQVGLVILLMGILCWFLGVGSQHVEVTHFDGFFDKGAQSIFATAGLVFVSYLGIGKIASVSEEVKNPERNLPLAMFLALATAIIFYSVGICVMVGVIPPETLSGNLKPAATAAKIFLGPTGNIVIVVAALLAFSSVANASIMSGSRYPLAMSRDDIFPKRFARINKHGVPVYSICFTVALIMVCLICFDAKKIAKLAGAFQLLLFAFNCLAVIIMRECKVDSYDPSFRSPFYPWLQILGFFLPFLLISQMGLLPISFTFALMAFGTGWYFKKVHGNVTRVGAIYHIFERLGQKRFEGLDSELRGILKEKGLRACDPFDEVVARADVIDLGEDQSFEDMVQAASVLLTKRVPATFDELNDGFLRATGMGSTPVSQGAALPHLRLANLDHTEMVLVRARQRVYIPPETGAGKVDEEAQRVTAVFFVISPLNNPAQHLRMLAEIAGRVDSEKFAESWLAATTDQQIKEILLRDERYLSIHLVPGSAAGKLIDKTLRNLPLGDDCLVAMIRRGDVTFVPHGPSVLRADDRLTIIGSPEGIEKLRQQYR
ncbi:MAG: APA family basic amino acid/polyamine antiporter [Candidatus Promineifilaceae bacterium]